MSDIYKRLVDDQIRSALGGDATNYASAHALSVAPALADTAYGQALIEAQTRANLGSFAQQTGTDIAFASIAEQQLADARRRENLALHGTLPPRAFSDELWVLTDAFQDLSRRVAAPIERAYSGLGLSRGPELARTIDDLSALRAAYAAEFHSPALDELHRLVDSVTADLDWTRRILGDDLRAAGLRGVLESLHSPWLHNQHAEASTRATAELLALGRAATIEPFVGASAMLREGLGDWRDHITNPMVAWLEPSGRRSFYVEQGYNPALTEFTPTAFHEVLEQADLILWDQRSGDGADDEEDDDLGRARAAYARLRKFEQDIRAFIVRVMAAEFGKDWAKQQLPAELHERWRAKQETARRAGTDVHPLIEYADFTDYRTIFERSDNWERVFKRVFGRMEDMRESFQRLYPVRLATMHARGVSQDDILFLTVEIHRLQRAIRRAETSVG